MFALIPFALFSILSSRHGNRTMTDSVVTATESSAPTTTTTTNATTTIDLDSPLEINDRCQVYWRGGVGRGGGSATTSPSAKSSASPDDDPEREGTNDPSSLSQQQQQPLLLAAMVVARRPKAHRKRKNKRVSAVADNVAGLAPSEIEYYVHYVEHDRYVNE